MAIDPKSIRWDSAGNSSPVSVIPLPPSRRDARADRQENRKDATDARNAANEAARIRIAQAELQANLAKSGLRMNARGVVEPIPNWRPTGNEQTAARSGQLRDRVTALQNLEASLGNVQSLYDKNLKGRPASRLGGLSEFVPGALNSRNQQFDDAAMRLGPFIQSILGLSSTQSDAAKEYERKVMPFIPTASNFDNTNEDKLRQLWDFLKTQRTNTHQELGIPVPRSSTPTAQPAPRTIRFDRNGNRIK